MVPIPAGPLGPSAVGSGRGWDYLPAPPAVQPTLQGGGGHHPPRAPPRNLCPTAHKGARSNGGTTMLGNPPRQRQRWGRQRQSPSHPRLCENHKRSLIGGPRKKGVQGVGDIGAGPAQPVLSPLRPPLVPLWLLSGHPERSSPPGRRNTQTRRRRRHPPSSCVRKRKKPHHIVHQKSIINFGKKREIFFKKSLTRTGVLMYDTKVPVRGATAMIREIALKRGNFRGVCPS